MKIHPLITKLLNYSWGTVINRLLIFLLVPVLSRFLCPEEFAVYSILLLFAALGGYFFQLGLHQSLLTLYHRQPGNSSKKSLISTAFLAVTVNSVFWLLLIIFLRKHISALLINSPTDYSSLVVITAFTIFLDVFYALTLVLLNIRQQSRQYSTLNLTRNLATLVGVLILSITRTLDLQNFFYVILIASLAGCLHAFFYIKRIYNSLGPQRSSFSGLQLRQLLKFGLYMIPATLGVISLQSADRYMLNILSPRTLFDTGIYSVAYKMGMIMSLFTVIFDLLFFPYIMQQAKKDYIKKQLRRLYRFYCLAATLTGIIIIIFSKELFLIIDGSYQEGASLVFFGVISVFLRGLSNLLVLGFYLKQKSAKIALASVLAALLNIFLNWLWIPHWGMLGAGFASLAAYLFIVIFNLITVEKAYKTGYNPLIMSASIIMLFLASALNYKIDIISLQMIAFKAAGSIVFIIAVWLLLRKDEFIAGLIKRRKGEV